MHKHNSCTAQMGRSYLQHHHSARQQTYIPSIHGGCRGNKPVAALLAATRAPTAQHSHAAWPATGQPAGQQVQRQHRRRTRQVIAEPENKQEGSEVLKDCVPQPVTSAVFYIPFGFEAAAAAACRRAGVALADLEPMLADVPLCRTHALPTDTPAAEAAATVTAAPSSTVPMWPHHQQQQQQQPAPLKGQPQQQSEEEQRVALSQLEHMTESLRQSLLEHHQHMLQDNQLQLQEEHQVREPPTQQVQNAAPAAAPDVSASSTTGSEAAPAAWQLAVDRRLAAASTSTIASKPAPATTRSISRARLRRWGAGTAITKHHRRPGSAGVAGAFSATSVAASSSGAQADMLSSSDRLDVYQQQHLAGQQLSPEAEAELCEMYQTYLHLNQTLGPSLQQHLQQQQQQQDGTHSSWSAPAGVAQQLAHAAAAQHQGVMAQELLLQLYHPLVVTRAARAQQQQPGADSRELLAAARRGLLQAAAKFDRTRTTANMRLVGLAEQYIKTALRDVLREYQTGAVTLPVHIVQLRSKLLKLESQLQLQRGSKPNMAELAAAAGVTLRQAERAMEATAGQATGLSEGGGGGGDDAEAAGGDVDLQRLDASAELDEVEAVAEGAVKASRSGLHEEQDDAAEAAALAAVMQQFIMQLPDRDRSLLSMRIGLKTGTSTAAAAAATSQQQQLQDHHQRRYQHVQEAGVAVQLARATPGSARGAVSASHGNSAAAAAAAAAAAGLLAPHAVGDEGLTLTELAKRFNMSRQRTHQIMDGAVKQLRQWLQEAAESDAEVARLLAGQGGKLAQEAGVGRQRARAA